MTDADAALSAAAEAGEAAADAAVDAAAAAAARRKRAWEDGDVDGHDGLFALALPPGAAEGLGRLEGAEGLLEAVPEGESPSSSASAAARRGPSPLLRPSHPAAAAAAAGGAGVEGAGLLGPKRPRLAVAGGGARSDPRTELSDAVMNANITNPSALIRPYALLRPRTQPALSPETILSAPPRALALAPRPGAGGYPTALAGPTAAVAAMAMEGMAARGYLPVAPGAMGGPSAGAGGAAGGMEVRSLLDSSLYDTTSHAAPGHGPGLAAGGTGEGTGEGEWGGYEEDPYAAAAADVSFAPTSAGGFRDAEEMRAGGARMSFAGSGGIGPGGDLSFAASSDRFGRSEAGGDGHDGLFGYYTNAPGLGGIHALGPSFGSLAGSELGFELASPSQIGSEGLDITTGSAAAAAAAAAAGLGADASLAGPGVDAQGRPSAAERAKLDRAHTEVMTRATHTFHLIIDAAFRAADAAAAASAAATGAAAPAAGTATVLFSRALARAGARTRREAAVSFVQLLALRALGFLTTRQSSAFGEIVVGRGPRWVPPAAVPVGRRVRVSAFGTPTAPARAPAHAYVEGGAAAEALGTAAGAGCVTSAGAALVCLRCLWRIAPAPARAAQHPWSLRCCSGRRHGRRHGQGHGHG